MKALLKMKGMSDMEERSIQVELETGLQARPAAQFVQDANGFTANIYLDKDGKRVNAKSIMGLMSLAIMSGETILLIADGPDEVKALDYLESFVKKTERNHL